MRAGRKVSDLGVTGKRLFSICLVKDRKTDIQKTQIWAKEKSKNGITSQFWKLE